LKVQRWELNHCDLPDPFSKKIAIIQKQLKEVNATSPSLADVEERLEIRGNDDEEARTKTDPAPVFHPSRPQNALTPGNE
jgi:hypothetical protein